MSAQIYSMNDGKVIVHQLKNSRVLEFGNSSQYQVRKNNSSDWRNSLVTWGTQIKLVEKVKAALR